MLTDACVVIAKVRGKDPPFQQQHTDSFFNLVKNNPLKILIIKKVLKEIKKKYDYLMPSVNKTLKELEADKKFKLIKNIPPIQTPKVLKIIKKAKKMDYNLSFNDASQVFYVKKKQNTFN